MKNKKTLWTCTLILTIVLSTSSFAQQKKNEEEKQAENQWRYKYSFEELKDIAKKEHDPKLELKPLKLLPKPGKYELKNKFTSVSSGKFTGEKTTEAAVSVLTKYIDGKFVVNYYPETIKWEITTYSNRCKCYRSWLISGRHKETTGISIGKRIGKSHFISWTVYNPGEGYVGHTIGDFQPKANKKDWTLTGSKFRNGELIGRTKSVARFQTPFDEIDKDTIDKIIKEFESDDHFTSEDLPDFTDMSKQEIEKHKDEIKRLIWMIDWSMRRKDYRRVDRLLKKVYPVKDQLDRWKKKLETTRFKVSRKLGKTLDQGPNLSPDSAISIRKTHPGKQDHHKFFWPGKTGEGNVDMEFIAKTPVFPLWYIFEEVRVIEGKEVLPDKLYDIKSKNKLHDRDEVKSEIKKAYRQAFGVEIKKMKKSRQVFLMKTSSAEKFQPEESSADEEFFMGTREGKYKFRAVTMDQIRRFLNKRLERPVINRTGRTGKYNFKAEISAFNDEKAILNELERLGFKIVETQHPIQTLVIKPLSDREGPAK